MNAATDPALRKPNPAYGSGVFRRSLRLWVAARQVDVELEDCNHAFRLRLQHDGERVEEVTAEVCRHPFVTCPEAVVPLRRLIGEALDADSAALRQRVPAGDNCTHLHDMGLLALAHAREPGLQRRYDISVDDEHNGLTLATIACDGTVVHGWLIHQHQMKLPQGFAGNPLKRGFYAWVATAFTGMPLEAAVALQRGYYVAQSRRTLSAPAVDNPASADRMPAGSCYSYNPGVVERALRVEGSIWDLSDKPDVLLQFRTRP